MKSTTEKSRDNENLKKLEPVACDGDINIFNVPMTLRSDVVNNEKKVLLENNQNDKSIAQDINIHYCKPSENAGIGDEVLLDALDSEAFFNDILNEQVGSQPLTSTLKTSANDSVKYTDSLADKHDDNEKSLPSINTFCNNENKNGNMSAKNSLQSETPSPSISSKNDQTSLSAQRLQPDTGGCLSHEANVVACSVSAGPVCADKVSGGLVSAGSVSAGSVSVGLVSASSVSAGSVSGNSVSAAPVSAVSWSKGQQIVDNAGRIVQVY